MTEAEQIVELLRQILAKWPHEELIRFRELTRRGAIKRDDGSLPHDVWMRIDQLGDIVRGQEVILAQLFTELVERWSFEGR